jgi:cell division protein FtsI (penicillin-binding protein 3)
MARRRGRRRWHRAQAVRRLPPTRLRGRRACRCARLLLRAAQIQLVKPDFFQKEGEKRYAHSLEVPATRGRVLDRSGQLLATSVPVPSVWAIPKDLKATPEQRRDLLPACAML